MLTEFVQKTVRNCMRIFCLFPIKSNRIIFNSHKGSQYVCNPRYIYEFLEKKHGERMQYVWCLNNNPPESLKKHKSVRIVKYNSLQYFYYQMTSKVIIANIPSPCYVPRRKKQYMIDTWHGGGAYKRIGTSMPKQSSLSNVSKNGIKTTESSDNTKWELYKAHYNALDTSIFLSSSKRFTEVMYESQLLPKEAYIETGMPRNDVFFCDYKAIGEKAKQQLGIAKDKKVMLFAPTYRGNVQNQQFNMVLDIQKCLDAAKERWGGEWVFAYRMHIFSSSLAKDSIPECAVNASHYDEMQELLCMADAFITDYSSSQWDFALTKKPAFLFTPDLEYYLHKDRGFYTSIEDWAFPYAKTNDELVELIRNFDEMSHLKKVKKHLDMLGSCDDGHATERVCELIENHLTAK